MFDITNNGYTISTSFSDEVCSKYLCMRVNHRIMVLCAAIKHIIGFDIYNKLIKNGGIVLDGDGHVVKILVSTTLSFSKKEGN